MISTIDEAVEVLNRCSYRGRSDWRLIDGECALQRHVTSVNTPYRNLDEWEAIALARDLNGDYASLSSKLERADHVLKSAWKSVSGCLADLPDFPCRMDEMTEREARIAEPVSFCVGTLKFLYDYLDSERSALAETSCDPEKS